MKKILFCLVTVFIVTSCSSSQKTEDTPLTQNNPQDEMMKAHCQMMPNMPGCEKYTGKDTSQTNTKTLNDLILTDDETVTDVKPRENVVLKDGEIYDLTIQKVRKVINGKTFIMLSYNGSIPGPNFQVPKGATVTFRVKNTVKELATTLHPHGLRLNYIYDWVPKEQWWVQYPIKEGETYKQVLTFPDSGIFWYHPHTRDDFEQELGEYGTFQVIDPKEKKDYQSQDLVDLDDILIENGVIPPFESDRTNYALMGRYGNTMFINGEQSVHLQMKQGEIKQVAFINTANARPFRISIPWMKMKLISGDNSVYQKQSFVDSLIIAPAERYTIQIYAEKSGNYSLEHTGNSRPITLWDITVLPNENVDSSIKKEFNTLKQTDILWNIKISDYINKKADKSITFQMTMNGMGGMSGGGMMNMNDSDIIEWEDSMPWMNRNMTDKSLTWEIIDDQTQKKNMDIDWSFKKGSLVKIHIYNDPNAMHAMQHTFHMHGQRFLVLDTNGKKNENLVWKDTVLIPKGESVDILVDMNNPWKWMAHCHITEHLFAGMMFDYTVTE